MRRKLDGCEDCRRTVCSSYNTQRSRFLRCETERKAHQKHSKNTELGSCAENREFEVPQHRPEIRHCAHSHKYYRWQKSGFDESIVEVVHNSELVGNLVQRHFPDILESSVRKFHHSARICLYHTHFSARKVCYQHSECYGDEQQRLVFFYYAQVQQPEGQQVHKQESRLRNQVTQGGHSVEFPQSIKKSFHYPLVILMIMSSSSTVSPLWARISVMVPSKSAQMALLIFIASI